MDHYKYFIYVTLFKLVTGKCNILDAKDFGVIYINCSIEINKLLFYLPFCMDEILRHNKYTIREYAFVPALHRSR